jgi:hypothetical protein
VGKLPALMPPKRTVIKSVLSAETPGYFCEIFRPGFLVGLGRKSRSLLRNGGQVPREKVQFFCKRLPPVNEKMVFSPDLANTSL